MPRYGISALLLGSHPTIRFYDHVLLARVPIRGSYSVFA